MTIFVFWQSNSYGPDKGIHTVSIYPVYCYMSKIFHNEFCFHNEPCKIMQDGVACYLRTYFCYCQAAFFFLVHQGLI